MSGGGAAPGGVPGVDLSESHNLRVVVIASSWHQAIMNALVEGATRACAEYGVDPTLVWVPGTFELPVVAMRLARSGADAIVALGVVIRGGTPHFEYVCQAATSGLSRVALDTGVSVGFGVLTCDTEAQAVDRAGGPGAQEDKGREAAEAALATALILRRTASLP